MTPGLTPAQMESFRRALDFEFNIPTEGLLVYKQLLYESLNEIDRLTEELACLAKEYDEEVISHDIEEKNLKETRNQLRTENASLRAALINLDEVIAQEDMQRGSEIYLHRIVREALQPAKEKP